VNCENPLDSWKTYDLGQNLHQRLIIDAARPGEEVPSNRMIREGLNKRKKCLQLSRLVTKKNGVKRRKLW